MTYETFHNTTIGELMSVQAARFPNQTFLRLGDERWSYAETELQAASLAAGLRGLGLQPGDRLAVILPNTPAYIVTVFAAAKAGLVLVPINVRRDKADTLARFAKTRPRALVAFSEAKEFDGVDHLEVAVEMRDQIPELEFVISVSASRSNKKKGIIAWESFLKDTAALAPAAPSCSRT